MSIKKEVTHATSLIDRILCFCIEDDILSLLHRSLGVLC
jgi:hypothetical protein